ncbi:MAG TPA: zf-HC2 domain-containing protein [Nocardioidaceae bacterium]|nr:zf-HC2 domain-containing protein [Nocardioidaceae bacterium]
MTHPSVEQVADYLEGVLGTDEQDRVRAHLEECEACTATSRDLATMPQTLRTAAATTPPMPEQVAARLQAVLADEARRRPRPVAVSDLAGRRQRRRRALTGGLLAAAAVTVVAIGLGEVVGTDGGGSAGESAVSGRAPADAADPGRPNAGRPGPDGAPAQRRGPGVAIAPEARRGRGDSPEPFLRGLTPAELIDAVAASHVPGTVRRDRPACVDAALGGGARTAAAYAVRLPAGSGGTRGLVVLRPGVAPTEGVLLACDPPPRVLLRRGLSD